MTGDQVGALLRGLAALDPFGIPEREGPAEYEGLIDLVNSWAPPVKGPGPAAVA